MTVSPIDYSSRDFASLLQDLVTNARELLPEWANITNPTDFGAVLLELFAYVGDINNYYIDRIANEAFLSTAQRTQSVLNIAKMFNYSPVAMAPATTTMRFTMIAGAETTTVPAGTQVSTTPTAGNDPLIFETDEDLIISGSDAATPVSPGTDTVGATQGFTVSGEILTDNAEGKLNATYTLFQPNVINTHGNEITIDVTDPSTTTTWRQVDNLLNSLPSDKVFDATIDENAMITINFGDNVFGLAPPQGVTITATYRVGVGASGNIAIGQLVELVSPIENIDTVTNITAPTGGADAESIASMRSSIPKSLFTLNRAVTTADFAALALQVAGIAKAQATATVYTSVQLYLAPVGGGLTTGPYTSPGTAKYAVDQYLADKKLVNVVVSYLDPTYVAVDISASVFVLANYYQPTVQNAVTTVLGELLDFDNVDFAQQLTISQVYHAIQSVPGVDYVTLTKLVRHDAATPSGVNTIVSGNGEIPELGTLTLTMTGGVQ